MANVTVIPARRRRMQTNEEQIIPKIKVAAYCRVSTDSDEQATSYEMQSMERHSLQKISAVFYLHDEYEKCFCMTKSN